MRLSGKLSTNTISSGTGYLFSILLALFVSPYIVRTLGDSRYGAWTLIAEVTGYYGLLDFGIRAAVTYYVGTHTARGNRGGINETAASAFWLLAGIGLAVIGICAGVVIASPALLQVKNIPPVEIRSAMLIMAATLGCTLPMDVFAAVLYGRKRLELVNGIEIGGRMLTSVLIVVALKAGGNLIHVSALQACAKAAEWALTWILAHRISPGLSVAPRFTSLAAVRALGDFGSKNLIINVARMAMDRTDLAIVGALMGARAVTFYTLGRALVLYSFSGVNALTLAFRLHLTDHHATGDDRRLKSLYLTGARLSGLVSTLLTAYILAFGASFIRLWVGSKYVTGDWTLRSDVVLWILAARNLPRLLQHMSYQLLYACRRLTFVTCMNVAEACVKLLLSLLLVRRYGLAGVALGTLAPMLVTNGVLLPAYVLRGFRIALPEYLRDGVGRPLAAGLLAAVAGIAITRFRVPATWPAFIAATAAFLAVAAVLTLFAGMAPEDRQAIRRLLPSSAPRA